MLKVVCSWWRLMQLAHAAGQAKMLMLKYPTSENRQAWERAVAEHDQYRDMCLQADEML